LFLRALGVTIVRHSDRVLRISLPGGLVLFAPIVNLTHGELIGGVSPPHAESAFQQAMEMLFYVAYADQYDACRLIRDGDSVIDLGANVGVFTILASRLVGEGGLVVAVEPLAQNQECLELTCSQNNLSNVMIIRQAVGGHEGEVQLNFAPRIGAHSAVAIRSSVPSTVPMRTVDRLLADHGIEQAHFVKIDIEGMEAEALEGARATLRQHGPVLAVSSYHLPGDVERLSSIIEHIRGDYCIRHERFARDLDPVLLAQPDGGDSR